MTQIVNTTSPQGDSGSADRLEMSETAPAGGRHLFAAIHKLLRGRYAWAISLGLLGLMLGGFLGYRSQPLQYRSTGLVRIRPNLPRILFQNEQNGVMPMFEAFVEGQVALMQSQRVSDLAMENPDWRALGRGLSPEAVIEYRENLKVTRTRSSELIEVAFVDSDLNAAMVAVRSVIESYTKLYGDSDPDSSAQRLSVLEERRTTLSNELKNYNDRILVIANEYGSNSLQQIYDFRFQEVNRLESQLRQLQMEIASSAAAVANAGGTTQPSPATQPASAQAATQPATAPAPFIRRLPPGVIAQTDAQMRQYLQQRRDAERFIAQLLVQVGENHSRAVEARRALELLDKDIADYAEEFNQALAHGTVGMVPGAPDQTIDNLRAQERNLQALYKRAREDLLEVGRKNLQIESLKTDVESVRAKLDETRRRIDQLNVEASVTGRVTVVSSGDRPLVPFNDKRVSRTVLGGFAGGALGLGLVMLVGLMDRRFRYVADAHGDFDRRSRMLGILPNLPRDLADPEQAMLAKYCVHHIRALLQIHCKDVQNPVYAITSPSPGAGKTSLSAALGLSFAASGARTLLIDCDVVGGGLTRRMDAIVRRKLGRILCREGLLSEQQFTTAMEEAERSRRRLGEVIVDMGFLTSADIERALSLQQESTVGLMEVLAGERLVDCVTGTGIANLFLLPLGALVDRHVAQLSPTGVRRIVEEARANYDTVIIDTGPVLGSLDAPMVAAVADEVVMVLSHGEQRDPARRAVDFLFSTGAKMAGIVFNRANEADMMASGYYSGNRSLAGDALGETSTGRLGPVAGAIARMGAPAGGNGNGNSRHKAQSTEQPTE